MSGARSGATAGASGKGGGRGIRLLSGGAAEQVAGALAPLFLAATGAELRPTFAPVGAVREALLAGEPCDVVIVTRAVAEELALAGRVVPGSVSALGSVHTGIAVRAGEAAPPVGRRDEFRASLATAPELYLPDPERATAGIHLVRVLRALGLYESAAPRLRACPNGASAMRALADGAAPGALGCAQCTEINAVPGVRLAGPLPGEFSLATEYAIGVCAGAPEPALAAEFARMASGPRLRGLRAAAGFELE